MITSSAAADRFVSFPIIDRGWSFLGGDGAGLAAPELDDSGWAILDSGVLDEPDLRAPGHIGWLRREVVVPASLAGARLYMMLAHTRPLEVYVDGAKFFAAGDVALSAQGGRTEVNVRQFTEPISLAPGRHVIAVRLSLRPAPLRADAEPRPSLLVGIGDSAHLELFEDETHTVDQISGLFVGATLALSLIHFLLFLMIRGQRANAYYALSSFSVSMTVFGGMFAQEVRTLEALLAVAVLTKIAIVLTGVFGVRFYYEAFGIQVPLRVWILRGIGVVMTLSAFFLTQGAVFVFALFALGEQMRVLVIATLQRKRGAWILLVGGGASIVTSVVQLLSMLRITDYEVPQLLYLYGFMVLLFSMSIYLARNFADAVKLEETLRALEVAHAELRRTQAQLAQSERMASLGQLVAGIAHEINTPIGAMASIQDSQKRAFTKLTEILDAELGEGMKQHKKLGTVLDVIREGNRVIEVGSTRVGELVKRLKTFARLDEAELKHADLHEGLNDTLMLLDHELRGAVDVVKEYGALPPVACYPAQLNQVFLNLIHNARQAIEGHGTITITTAITGERAVIRVRDTGVGIPPENLKRIFDPGFTTKGVRVGAGLGLAICYRIVEEHQGELTVESEVGAGSRFTVSIPLDLERRLAAVAAQGGSPRRDAIDAAKPR